MPDGEATSPLESVTEVWWSPYIADQIGQITEPFRMEIAGKNHRHRGRKAGDGAKGILEKGTRRVQCRIPVALGTNPACLVIPKPGRLQKLGTAHIAIGDNISLGEKQGTFHIDFVFLNPSVYLDGKCILKDGSTRSSGR